jgi:alkanesulfonate monooxygenase SsuD/methylene tetrahydromethanopterin reductase-like flavin-dependent oxidoreductase (luciferase family)
VVAGGVAMKFGLFYEMFVPPEEMDSEPAIIRQTVEQIVHADRHNWDYVWLTEHHFLGGFSHMSAPEVVFGAAAFATEHIRFGFGLALTPPTYNHPVRIAERAAMLDCLSGGRVDIGSGRSTTPAELYGFGLDPDESRAQWEEGLDAVARLMSEENVSLDGKYVKMPPRTVYPRPVQKPHPPMWVGGVGPGNAERAAKRGLGMLFFALKAEPEALRESIRAYKDNIGNARSVSGAVNNQTAGFVNGLCTADPSQRDAIRELAANKTVEHTYHGNTHMLTGWPGGVAPPSYAHVTAGEVQALHDAICADRDAVADELLRGGFVMAGTTEDCIPVIDAFQEAGVDQLIVHMQMGNVPHERIMESIETLGTEVIPKYR